MTDYTNAEVEEFAQKYAGQDIYLIDYDTNARIIGFYSDLPSPHMLIVDFPINSKYRAQCWEISNYMANVHLTINEDVKFGYVVDRNKVKVIIKPDPYPHVCKSCNSPARINGLMIACSNLGCKIGRRYIKSLTKHR